MKAKKVLAFIFFAVFFMTVFAQDARSENGNHFLVDFETFSLPVKKMAESFEEKPAE